ncbi:Eukaryotic protein of unknown function (DUF914) [Abeliophyllum distichum]|uniref:Solute carrier family 35 member F1 n=1 Tax=Abeliophyllum distichum TaxID=126358 RepID=A0ABD1RFK5_9LAMI
MSISWWRNNEGMIRTLFPLFLGQLLSFNLAISTLTSSFVANQGVDAPLTLSFFTYLALAVVYGSILLYRRQKLQVSWYWFVLLGFADVQGNCLVNKAFEFTSVTSVTILDCWTIPWAMVFTWIFLDTRYSLRQFFGVAVCLSGLGLALLSDARVGGGGGSRPLLGDVLVIAGTLFCSISTVGQEFFVKKIDRVEVIAMIGLFGMLVSASEISIVERKNLNSIKWSTKLISAFSGYALSSFTFYTSVPFVLKISGATMLCLSLLTSGMWAVVIRRFIYKEQVQSLYYLAFALVVVGVVMYSKTEKDPDSARALENSDLNTEYLLFDEENLVTRNDTSVS